MGAGLRAGPLFFVDIQAASLAQLRQGRDGRQYLISEDVGDIAKRLRELDPNLRLAYNEHGEFYVVYELVGGKETLVLTAQDCDARIVERCRYLASADYDYLAEVERLDKEAEKERQWQFREQVGPHAERLAHALRRDRATRNRAHVPGDRPSMGDKKTGGDGTAPREADGSG